MTVDKHPILQHMIRQVTEQFNLIDHRLIRKQQIDYLSHQVSALYLYLMTVGDNLGLSYYIDNTLGKWLNLNMPALNEVGTQLAHRRLIAYLPTRSNTTGDLSRKTLHHASHPTGRP